MNAAGAAATLGLSSAAYSALTSADIPTSIEDLKMYYSEEPILLSFHLIMPQPGTIKDMTQECYAYPDGCTPSIFPLFLLFIADKPLFLYKTLAMELLHGLTLEENGMLQNSCT